MDQRITAVRWLYAGGQILSFADIFKYAQPAPLAPYCQIPRSRFRNTSLLSVNEILTLHRLFQIPATTLLGWCRPAINTTKKITLSPHDALQIDIIGDRIALGKLQEFSSLFTIIARSSVAKILNLHNDRMARLVFQPDNINVKLIYRFAHLFNIPAATLFHLIENDCLTKAHLPIKALKPSIKILPQKLSA